MVKGSVGAGSHASLGMSKFLPKDGPADAVELGTIPVVVVLQFLELVGGGAVVPVLDKYLTAQACNEIAGDILGKMKQRG